MGFRKSVRRSTPGQALEYVREAAGFCTRCEAIVMEGVDDVGTPTCPVCGAASVVSAQDAQLGGSLFVGEDDRPTLEGMLPRDEKPRTRGSLIPRRGGRLESERRDAITMTKRRQALARRTGEAA